jgi:5'-3' exonuclease
MFDNKKYVEEYRAGDVAEQLGLDRPKLIRMAHLLGSDYTTGISGIGASETQPQAAHTVQQRSFFAIVGKW